MNATISSSGKWHGLVLLVEKRSQGWNNMKQQQEHYKLLRWQVASLGPTHEEKVSWVEYHEAAA